MTRKERTNTKCTTILNRNIMKINFNKKSMKIVYYANLKAEKY
jgi:hypothetical protein